MLACLAACGGDGASVDSAAQLPARERRALIASAEQALDEGRIADALRLARYGVERAEGADTLELLGRALLAEASTGPADLRPARRREAAEVYRRAAELAPGSAGLQHAAALMLDTAGEEVEALRHHDRAVELAPDEILYRLHRANRRLRSGDLAGAEEDRAQLERLAPDNAWTHALGAELLLARGETGAAREAAARAQRLDPDEPALRVLRARAARLDGAASEAVELLTAVEPARRDATLTAELAAAWLALDRPDRAAEAWEHFAGRHPELLAPTLEAARARLAAGDRMRARAWFERARLIAPDDPEVKALERATAGEGT